MPARLNEGRQINGYRIQETCANFPSMSAPGALLTVATLPRGLVSEVKRILATSRDRVTRSRSHGAPAYTLRHTSGGGAIVDKISSSALYFANADRKFLKSLCSRSCPILWRPRRESNPRTRICSPLRSHSATRPLARASYRRGEAGASARTQQVAALAFLSATSRETSLAARIASLCSELPAASAVSTR